MTKEPLKELAGIVRGAAVPLEGVGGDYGPLLEAIGGARRQAGFYGIDLYSLHASIEAVLSYLDRVDPEAARRARSRYSCFEHFGENTQAYGYAATFGMAESCEQEVLGQLSELRRRASEYASRDGRVAEDEFFFAEQNARL